MKLRKSKRVAKKIFEYKWLKRYGNRRLRRCTKIAIDQNLAGNETALPVLRECGNKWDYE